MSSRFVTLTYQKNQLTEALSVKILVMLLGRSLERNAFHTLKNNYFVCEPHNITFQTTRCWVLCLAWNETPESWLQANFTSWKRADHQLKLLWKKKTWNNFEGAVEQNSWLDWQKSLLSFSLITFLYTFEWEWVVRNVEIIIVQKIH